MSSSMSGLTGAVQPYLTLHGQYLKALSDEFYARRRKRQVLRDIAYSNVANQIGIYYTARGDLLRANGSPKKKHSSALSIGYTLFHSDMHNLKDGIMLTMSRSEVHHVITQIHGSGIRW